MAWRAAGIRTSVRVSLSREGYALSALAFDVGPRCTVPPCCCLRDPVSISLGQHCGGPDGLPLALLPRVSLRHLNTVLPYGTVHTAPRPCSCQANGYDIGLSFDSRRVRRTLSDRTTSQNTLATVNQPKPWLSGVTLAVVTVAWSLASDAGHGKGRYGVVDARPQGGTRHSLNRQGVGKQSKQEPSNT